MEKITDKIRALPPNATYFSLEFFPPKTEIGLENLQGRLSRMSQALRPLFVTVTWGAGGTTFGRSLELAAICQRQLGLTTCLHLTCTNMSKKVLDDALRDAKEIGIRNILALRGDVPRDDEYHANGIRSHQATEFVWASDLVRYIRKEYGDFFCIGVAGYPEGHADESHPVNQDPKDDMPYLAEKVKAGADFIITQLFYDVRAYLEYERLVNEWDNGALSDTILIPGLMPIQRYQNLKRICNLSHATLPQSIFEHLQPVQGNDDDVKRVGIDVLSDIVRQIVGRTSKQRRGFHFYTLNLEKSVSFILDRCSLITPATPEDKDEPEKGESAIDDAATENLAQTLRTSRKATHLRPHRRSSAHNLINDGASSTGTMEPQSRAVTLDITRGIGALGREATWDEYPNGRFGDARSPAFGEIDGYGPSLHLSAEAARSKWGTPTSREDLTKLFLAHIRGEVDQLPWSEGLLNAETRTIENDLAQLISKKGWLSVVSQPAVDGRKSADSVFGWGPPGGFVFQKAFVEFWIPAEDWRKRLRPHLQAEDIAEQVSWYCSSRPRRSGVIPHSNGVPGDGNSPLKGGLSTNGTVDDDPKLSEEDIDESYAASAAKARDSVTWGVFPGKEIVTPTMIEEISFRAWAEEAFGIWGEWERCYPLGSDTRQFLARCQDEYLLVNVIGHAFREERALWDILLKA